MWEEAYRQYLAYERHYSEGTVTVYTSAVAEFAAYLRGFDPEARVEDARADDIRGWLMALLDAGNVATTVNKKLSGLKNFYRFLKYRGCPAPNPAARVEGPKRGKPLPCYVREGDMEHLLDGAIDAQDFEAVRDRMLMEMLYSTGMRLGELLGLRDGDVDGSARLLRVTGKRDKQRLIPYGPLLARHMDAYCALRDSRTDAARESGGAFFVRKSGKPLTRANIYRIVKAQLSGIAALKKRSPHVLRHTFATALLNHGAELNAVQALLGHESLGTTQIYTHATFEELRKVYNQAHPRA